MIIFLIALLAISAVAFIAFLFSKSKSKRRNLLISGIVAIASVVAIGAVNAQSGDKTGDTNEPKTEETASNKKDNDTTSEKTDDTDTTDSDKTNNNDTTNSNEQPKPEPSYRAATYELDKTIATTTSGIGSATMTIDAYNSLTIGQLTLVQTLATYGVPSNTSGGTEGSTVMNIVYPTDQTNYSVDLQFTKSTSGTWLLSTKNSMKTTGITSPQYTRQ